MSWFICLREALSAVSACHVPRTPVGGQKKHTRAFFCVVVCNVFFVPPRAPALRFPPSSTVYACPLRASSDGVEITAVLEQHFILHPSSLSHSFVYPFFTLLQKRFSRDCLISEYGDAINASNWCLEIERVRVRTRRWRLAAIGHMQGRTRRPWKNKHGPRPTWNRFLRAGEAVLVVVKVAVVAAESERKECVCCAR